MSTTDARLKARKLRLDAYCPDEPMNPAVNMDTYILMATRLSEQATACEAAGALARICPRTGAPVTTTADALHSFCCFRLFPSRRPRQCLRAAGALLEAAHEHDPRPPELRGPPAVQDRDATAGEGGTAAARR